MNRIACAEAIAAALAPLDIVICSLGSVNRSWRAAGACNATYYCSDPMGLSVSIALGVALATPARRVIALCGDGDLLMGLSSLATVAGAGATNLRIILFNNGRYETGGGQPLASDRLCFTTVGRGMGLQFSEPVQEQADLAAGIDRLLAAGMAGLLCLAIDPDPLGYAAPPDIAQVEERTLFMHRLAETAR